MASELMYTSAPQGLKPGSTGFCTVMVTSGMPAPLSQRLESLSGYSPLPLSAGATVHHHPVSYAHWRAQIGGMNYSILSRICFAGADYSGRNNKFAHHVVLEPDEISPAGPAWLLMQKGVHEEHWSGEVRVISGGRHVPRSDDNLAAGVCNTWAETAGDAGYAGLLAEAFLLDSSKPAYVIYRPPLNLLPLMHEAILLLPRRERWAVTFNTYFTALPPGTTCAWRCCVAGTDAARSAAGSATSGVLIDLASGSKAPVTRNTRYVSFARTGRLAASEANESVSPSPRKDVPAVSAGRQAMHRPPPARKHAAQSTYRPKIDPDDLIRSLAQPADDDTFDVSPVSRRQRSVLAWSVWIAWPLLVLGIGGFIVASRFGSSEQRLVEKLEEKDAQLRDLERKLAANDVDLSEDRLAFAEKKGRGSFASEDFETGLVGDGSEEREVVKDDMTPEDTNRTKDDKPKPIDRGRTNDVGEKPHGRGRHREQPKEEKEPPPDSKDASGRPKGGRGVGKNEPADRPQTPREPKTLQVTAWNYEIPGGNVERYHVRIPENVIGPEESEWLTVEFDRLPQISMVSEIKMPVSSRLKSTPSNDGGIAVSVTIKSPFEDEKKTRVCEFKVADNKLMSRWNPADFTRTISDLENACLKLNDGAVLLQFGASGRVFKKIKLGATSQVENFPIKDVRLVTSESRNWEFNLGGAKKTGDLKVIMKHEEFEKPFVLSIGRKYVDWDPKNTDDFRQDKFIKNLDEELRVKSQYCCKYGGLSQAATAR